MTMTHQVTWRRVRDVVDDVTIRRALGTFLYGPYWTQTTNGLLSEIYLAPKLPTYRHVDWHLIDNKDRAGIVGGL